jgi:hypothetical protein
MIADLGEHWTAEFIPDERGPGGTVIVLFRGQLVTRQHHRRATVEAWELQLWAANAVSWLAESMKPLGARLPGDSAPVESYDDAGDERPVRRAS